MSRAGNKQPSPAPDPPPEGVGIGKLEVRDPRFAELDRLIAHQEAAATTALPLPDQRHSAPSRGEGGHPAGRSDSAAARLPEALRGEVIEYARLLARRHRAVFEADPKLRDRATRLFRRELPPKSRRPGRPQQPSVTAAIRLRKQFHQQFPDPSPQEGWERIAQAAIPGYGDLPPYRQSQERARLRQRVKACERQRRRRRRAEKSRQD